MNNMQPNTIQFYGKSGDERTEILRLSRDGVWANPDVPVDEAARAVLAAIDTNIKGLVRRAVEDERDRLQNDLEFRAMTEQGKH